MKSKKEEGKEEKAQAPAGTEAQAKIITRKSKDTEFPKRNDTWNESVCQWPVTPYNCPMVDDMRVSGYKDSVPHFLGFDFQDNNKLGLRPDTTSEVRVVIDLRWLDNTTNRTLAAICFFKWTGKEYEQISLYEDHEDLKYLVLGHIVEFEACEHTTVLQLLRKEIAACKAQLRGMPGEISEDRQADLKIRLAELMEQYKEAERERTLKDEAEG